MVCAGYCVAPHDGCVDWNLPSTQFIYDTKVAPHDGCVDWNIIEIVYILFYACRTPRWVRGLKFRQDKSVMLNRYVAPHDGCVDWNTVTSESVYINYVAPHDGCVDWNTIPLANPPICFASHPTMGAWIEICKDATPYTVLLCRTPRWVRGLKLHI